VTERGREGGGKDREGQTDRGGEKDREGRRAKRGDRQGGGTDREGEQTGRGDRQGGGTYIGVGTRCRSSVVASFAVRRQGVISVGVVPRRSSSLSGVGIVVHGWGIIVRVGARSASRFAQSSFVGRAVCRSWVPGSLYALMDW